jgi:hypothetical protein
LISDPALIDNYEFGQEDAMGQSLQVQINQPTPDEAVIIGTKLHVGGRAFGKGMPEPVQIKKVTVRVDNQTPINAILTPPKPFPRPKVPAWIFDADIDVPAPIGLHSIQVESFDDLGEKRGTAVVEINAGGVTFDAVATVKTDYPEAKGPYPINVEVSLDFTSSVVLLEEKVEIVSFPSIEIDAGFETVTISLFAGGTGQFNRYSGAMSLPVTLLFHHSSSAFSDSTLPLVLTTDAAVPSGPFSDHGGLMQANGKITLAADGQFQGGDPLGGNHASIVVEGTMSPSPKAVVV